MVQLNEIKRAQIEIFAIWCEYSCYVFEKSATPSVVSGENRTHSHRNAV